MNKIKYTEEFINNLADKLETWMQVEDNYWLGTFAAENNLHRQRFPDFAAKNDKFQEVFEKAKQRQETKLYFLGLSKDHNAAMAIFALKNVANWRDKTDITTGEEALSNGNQRFDITQLKPDELVVLSNMLKRINTTSDKIPETVTGEKVTSPSVG